MTPSLGCLNGVSLICPEEAQGNDWDDETESLNEPEQHLQRASLARGDSYLHNVFVFDQHLVEEDAEVIKQLMQKEASFMLHKEYTESYNGSDGAELQALRERAVYWMLTVQAYHGFNLCTAFLAVSYFDRFWANQQENFQQRRAPWLVQLSAVGCISLAAKVEEVEVPLLLDLQVGHVPHVFEARTIQRMELLILGTLKWRLSSVTPFSFLGFLLQKGKFRGRLHDDLLPRVEELILNSCGDPRFMVYSPSILAVASVMCACDELLTGQAASYKQLLLSVWPKRERIIAECAELMQELIGGVDHASWTSTRKLIASPNPSSAPESPNGVLDASCFSSDSGNTTFYSLKAPDKGQTLHSPGDAVADRTCVRSAIATAYSRSSSPSTCKTIDFCRKRKFNECYSTISMRTVPRGEASGGASE